MTYPQQPGNWQDQPWPADPAQQASGAPAQYAGYGIEPAYPTYGYQTPMVVAAAPRTNPLAIASLVCSLTGFVMCGVPSLVGAILGHVARKQIRERGEDGAGMALAGIITGWIIFGLMLLFGIFYVGVIVYAFNQDSQYDYNLLRALVTRAA
jgi:hypothetical protein